MTVEDASRTLGLHPGATEQAEKEAYRDRSTVWHPDPAGRDSYVPFEDMQPLLNQAYLTLTSYFKSGGGVGRPKAPPPSPLPPPEQCQEGARSPGAEQRATPKQSAPHDAETREVRGSTTPRAAARVTPRPALRATPLSPTSGSRFLCSRYLSARDTQANPPSFYCPGVS